MIDKEIMIEMGNMLDRIFALEKKNNDLKERLESLEDRISLMPSGIKCGG